MLLYWILSAWGPNAYVRVVTEGVPIQRVGRRVWGHKFVQCELSISRRIPPRYQRGRKSCLSKYKLALN
jgi:hypothetical protein